MTILSSNENGIKNDSKTVPLITGTGEILNDTNESTGKAVDWVQKKQLSIKFSDLLKKAREEDPTIISNSRLEAVCRCGDTLLFKEAENGRKKLYKAFFCKSRLCPICSWRRSLKTFSQVSDIMNTDIMQEHIKNGSRFLFMTLTVKNVSGDSLPHEIDSLNKGFQYLISPSRTVAGLTDFKKSIQGYIKTLEITYNHVSDTYHPHIHVLLMVRPSYFTGRAYLSVKALRTKWQDILNLDYVPQCDIKAIRDCNSKSIAEISKYPVKPIQWNYDMVPAIIALSRAMKGRRLLTYGGIFKRVKSALNLADVDSDDADLIHTDSSDTVLNPIAYTLYRYNRHLGVYIC